MNRLLKTIISARRVISVLLHIGLVVLANYGAFWLRFDGDIPPAFQEMWANLVPWLVVIRLSVFVPFRLFEGLWKYTSLWDLRNIVLGVLCSSAIFYPISAGSVQGYRYPQSIFIIDAVLLVCLMSAIRLSRRLYGELVRPSGGRRVLVYGAGDAGELIVRDMRQNARFEATPIGFIDDDVTKLGQRIHGVPVIGGRNDLERLIVETGAEELLLAIPSVSRHIVRSIVRTVERQKIRITTLPRLHDLVDGRVEVGQIRQLRLEDLLAREPIGFSHDAVERLLTGKRVLVTGAGGSIGAELSKQISAARPAELLLLDRYENSLFQVHQQLLAARLPVAIRAVIADVTDAARIAAVFAEHRPQIVFHAAAHKHVPLMEDNPCEAIKNNVRGTRIVAEAALRSATAKVVLISTDKAVNASSVMGASKRAAELLMHVLHERHQGVFITVRFGNVLASNGSVVPTFLEQIARGGPVTVTDPEMKRFFMLIPEAVQLVLQAAALEDKAPLFVLEMGEQIKVSDLARDLIRLSGLVPDKDIEIRYTGVRPGEKLFEELIGPDEVAEPSSVSKIISVSSSLAIDPDRFAISLQKLEQLACEGRSTEALAELREICCFGMPRQSVEV